MEETTTPISDLHHYTQLMRNGFMDKLFFADKLFAPWHSLVDYGCADGFLTKLIGKVFPNKVIVGYDEDENMLSIAQNTGEQISNVNFSSFEAGIAWTEVLNLSSVLHEVYSYKSEEEVNAFWQMAFSEKRTYVIIRDMCYMPPRGIRPSDTAVEAILHQAREALITGQLEQFQQLHGPITTPRSLIHWLTKYLYARTPNWEREVREDYMAITLEEIRSRIPSGWEITYEEHYTLPYLSERWYEDFGLRFSRSFPTHLKLIIRNYNK